MKYIFRVYILALFTFSLAAQDIIPNFYPIELTQDLSTTVKQLSLTSRYALRDGNAAKASLIAEEILKELGFFYKRLNLSPPYNFKLTTIPEGYFFIGFLKFLEVNDHRQYSGASMTKCLLLFLLYWPLAYASLTQVQFQKTIDQFVSFYGPIVANYGAELTLVAKWDNDEVDARASQWEEEWIIQINGGLARQPHVDSDTLLLILCHEMGHHLGGAPRTHIRTLFEKVGYWLSVEGQADYFASSKCIGNFFDDSTRITNAALNMLTTIAEKHDMEAPSLDQVDPTIVTHTIYKSYPSFQCRLDTLIAGMNCTISKDIPFDNKNPDIGACVDSQFARPRCWYKR